MAGGSIMCGVECRESRRCVVRVCLKCCGSAADCRQEVVVSTYFKHRPQL